MRNRRLIGWVVGIPVLVLLLIVFILTHETRSEGISRATAVKAAVLALTTPEELEAWRKEQGASHFPAEELEEWYVPYFDYLYEQGILSEEDIPPEAGQAEQPLTYGEAAQIAGSISPDLAGLIRAMKGNQEEAYPEEAWWLFYDSLLRAADPEGGVQTVNLLVYGTPENVEGAPAWTAYTSLGTVGFSGLVLDPFIDHEIKAYVRGSEIIHILADLSSSVTYKNVWLSESDGESLTVYVGEILRTLPLRKANPDLEAQLQNMADLKLEGGKVTHISVKKDIITGRVLSVGEDYIEIEGYGQVPLDDEYQVLKVYGGIRKQKLENILVGYDMEEFVVAKGKICGVLTVRAFEADKIRVLIMQEGYGGLFHQSLSLSCDRPVIMTQGEETQRLEAGEKLTFTVGEERLSEGRIILEPQDGGEIRVDSLARAQGHPSYSGRLEVLDTADGLVLVNELYLEDYLKKVVPSEMPASYEPEALKAQAVCARTYAYMQLQSNTYSRYGAHIDDSTNFQVYNNIETSPKTDAAVTDTYGKMLLYDGNPISAYYFSTSCGTTTDGTVWGMDASQTPYLKSIALQPGRKSLELETEEVFAAFIKRTDYPSYDADFPFYRWNVTTNGDILAAHIDGIGSITSVQVTLRGPGGVAKKLTVTGTEGERTISGQNAIRAALGDASLSIVRADGKTSEGWSSLPSGFLTVEEAGTSESGVKQFRIYGGGYGHGAGMSQNGAQGMAKAGIGYEEILTFFYEGVAVGER